ncbi:MAG: hypothetical protein PPP58_11780 [Natronomonas sp.]
MAKSTGTSPVSSHTEYTRGRRRCPFCGGYVTAEQSSGRRCQNCRGEASAD